jgi:hypothetical protein
MATRLLDGIDMARCELALWDPLPENETQPAIVPTQFIVHTAVDAPGPTDLYNYFDNPGIGVESHFWLTKSGGLSQGIDTEVRADANLEANVRAISIETEDDGDPEGNPWTEGQIDALIALGRWCVDRHDIPPILCPNPTAPGFGWHAMWSFRDPIRQIGAIRSPWTSSLGKTCPGKTRSWQYRAYVLPAIARTTTKPPTTGQYDQGTIDEIIRRLGNAD